MTVHVVIREWTFGLVDDVGQRLPGRRYAIAQYVSGDTRFLDEYTRADVQDIDLSRLAFRLPQEHQ